MEKVFFSKSDRETLKFAQKLAEGFRGGEVVLLGGELGAGKTVFAKGAAKALGIEEQVTSPTFAIHNQYQGRLALNHFDFYRLDEAEAEVLGLDEFFGAKDGVCLIEWWQNVKGLLPKKCIKVDIEKISDTERKITVDEYSGS